MRITRDALLKVVRDTVEKRVRSDRDIVSIYLCGSLLGEDFLLGGATDIDLVIIHSDTPRAAREIVAMTEEVHLDISHHMHRDYRNTRKLRVHPWMGPVIHSCQILHDPQHFMDFTQASVRGQFFNPEHIYARAHSAADHARQLWASLAEVGEAPGPKDLGQYLKAVDHAVVAVTSLSGPPLAERRFLLDFPKYAAEINRPGLAPGLLGLLGAPHAAGEQLQAWLADWQAAYQALPEENGPDRLHPKRMLYYRSAMEAMMLSDQPQSALWPLLRTWTLALRNLGEGAPELEAWNAAMLQLGLIGEGFAERSAALDAYLDMVEETLEEWAAKSGALAA